MTDRPEPSPAAPAAPHAAGMDGYIAKSLDLRVMRSEIRRVLRHAAGDDSDSPETRY